MRLSRLVLTVVILLLGLRTWSNRGYFWLQRTSVDSELLAGHLPYKPMCLTAETVAPTYETMLGTAPTYLNIVSQLSADDLDQHRAELENLARQTNHELARLLALESIVGSTNDPATWVRATETIEPEEKLHVAEFFLARAGQCVLEDEMGVARELLGIGIAVLPAGSEDDLEPILSRRVADIYFFDEEWELARQWYERADGTGGTPKLRIAQILVKQGDLHGALTAYETALPYYPDRVELLLEGAQVAASLKTYDRAANFLDRLDRAKLSVASLFTWAAICEEIGDMTCAIELYQLILEHEPGNIQAKTEMERLNASNN